MSNVVPRPSHLPDFLRPPLNEVAIGVQFSPPKGYQQIYAGEVRNLFREEFPRVEEHPALLPAFETFGLPSMMGQLDFLAGPTHDRFWFLNPEGDELIQFQQDRLHHNWRKVGDQANDYPRFETMIVRFHDELTKLQGYFSELTAQTLSINQCEISYINHIKPNSNQSLKASDWLRFVAFDNMEPDDFSCNFREVIKDESGKLLGRLVCSATIGIKPDGQRIIVMTLTARGTPKGPDIASAVEFLSKGRELIVSRFAEWTTKQSHKEWGRK